MSDPWFYLLLFGPMPLIAWVAAKATKAYMRRVCGCPLCMNLEGCK